MILSARPTFPPVVTTIFTHENCYVLCDFKKCVRKDRRTDIQIPRVKIVINTGRDSESALWINIVFA